MKKARRPGRRGVWAAGIGKNIVRMLRVRWLRVRTGSYGYRMQLWAIDIPETSMSGAVPAPGSSIPRPVVHSRILR